MEYAQLKFPPYDWLKALPKKHKVIRTTRDGEMFGDVEYCEYYFTLFDTPTSVRGRLTYNEDGSGMVYFDVMEDGYCDRNYLGMHVKFTKKNYEAVCSHAQAVYEDFQRELSKSWSWQWEDVTPEEYFAQRNGILRSTSTLL